MESYPKQKMEKSWVRTGITPEIVEWTKSFGKFLSESSSEKKALTTGQLRKFFGEVRRIDSDIVKHKNDIPMLKPMLAYAVGRDKTTIKGRVVSKSKIQEFEEELSVALSAIRFNSDEDMKSDFRNFVQIFESLVAYHKYFGGKDSNN